MHGDVKLQNMVLRMSDGKPMLIDFGLARHHHNKGAVDLPSYFAPELYAPFSLAVPPNTLSYPGKVGVY